MGRRYPHRIVCLTEEATETRYAPGEEDRIVGISRFTVRSPAARRDEPRVSALTTADVPAILQLQPGPAALTDGLDTIHRIGTEWSETTERVGPSSHRSSA